MLVPLPLAYSLIALMFICVISSVICVIAFMKKAKHDADMDTRLKEFDEAFEDAITEMNKIAVLINEEIDEKYKQTLFLYNLMGDKAHAKKEHKYKSIPKANIYDKVRELFTGGETITEIAKALGIGQGEVKLIIDLYNKKEA